MGILYLLHYHPLHRSRQLRWVFPTLGILFLATLTTMVVLYQVGNQDVSKEFWHAHKQISHTGQLLERGLTISVVVLAILVLAIGVWALRVTHRIVRPVHTMHRALEEMVSGNLGVRLELHRHDEFQEVGAALNRLLDEFNETLTKVHDLADRVETLAAEVAREAHDQSAEVQLHQLAKELNQTIDFFRQQPVQVIREEEA